MNIWIHNAGLLILAITLAACAREDQPSATTQPAAPQTTQAPVGKPLSKPVAKGVELSFSHDVLRDRVEKTKSGKYQRKVLLEYRGLDQQQVASTLIADMAEGGFKVTSERTDPEGRIRMTFQKGKRKITARVRHGGELETVSAAGAILITVPAKKPAKSDKTAEKDQPAG